MSCLVTVVMWCQTLHQHLHHCWKCHLKVQRYWSTRLSSILNFSVLNFPSILNGQKYFNGLCCLKHKHSRQHLWLQHTKEIDSRMINMRNMCYSWQCVIKHCCWRCLTFWLCQNLFLWQGIWHVDTWNLSYKYSCSSHHKGGFFPVFADSKPILSNDRSTRMKGFRCQLSEPLSSGSSMDEGSDRAETLEIIQNGYI